MTEINCNTDRKIKSNKGNHKHGMVGTPEYKAWNYMKVRCLYPSHDKYKYYGGRGITVFEPWKKDFLAFYNEIGPMPEPGMTIDRIDGSKNYEPDNVRWATQTEQARNKPSTIKLIYKGEEKTIPEWSEIVGIKAKTLEERIRAGWTAERALTVPVKKSKMYKYKGIEGTAKEIAEELGLSYIMLYERLRKGSSVEEAVEKPKQVRMYELNGKVQRIVEWAKEYGFPRNLVYDRIRNGWSIEKALTVPKNLKIANELLG